MVEFDTDAFERGLVAAAERYEADGARALDDFANDVVTTARSLAPTDTGELAASIQIHESGDAPDGPFVEFGSTLEKAIYNEFGTVHMPPHPFMRPAVAQASPAFGRTIRG